MTKSKHDLEFFNQAYARANPDAARIERQRIAQLSKQRVQDRLKAILDAPAVVNVVGIDGKSEQITIPALEAMTTKLVEMVLAKGEFASIRDKDRINAYRIVHDRVFGAPKQVVELVQEDPTDEDLRDLSPEALKTLELAHEQILINPEKKQLGK